MHRSFALVVGAGALLLGGAWLGAATSTTSAQLDSPSATSANLTDGTIVPFDPNPIKREPVLVYDFTGGTLVGTFHRNVVVYNNGFVTFARKDNIVFPDQQEVEDVEIGTATREQVRELIVRLTELGAFASRDNATQILDVPLATVTFFPRAGTRATANTFSFPSAGVSDVEVVIDDFVDIVLGM